MKQQPQKSSTQKRQELYKDLMNVLEESKVTTNHKSKIDNLLTLIIVNAQQQDTRIIELESQNWDLQMKARDLKKEVSAHNQKPLPSEREQELLELLNDSRKFFNKVKNQCFVAAYGESLNDWARRVTEVSSNYDSNIPAKHARYKKVV